jgi:hypothetical protein
MRAAARKWPDQVGRFQVKTQEFALEHRYAFTIFPAICFLYTANRFVDSLESGDGFGALIYGTAMVASVRALIEGHKLSVLLESRNKNKWQNLPAEEKKKLEALIAEVIKQRGGRNERAVQTENSEPLPPQP